MSKTVLFVLCLINKGITENVNKPNVLLIFVDDLRHLSTDEVILPNIKKMADTGVNFKNAFAQQALCAPSRNSILTGRRPDALHLYDFYSYWRDTVGNFMTLPQYFKEHGYDTYSVGKVFHPGKSSNFTDDYPYSWSHHPYHAPTEIYKDAAVCKNMITKKYQKNLICPVNVNNQPGKSLPDLQILDYAIKVLKNNRTKPLFLAVGFHKPHIPLKFPKHYLDKIPLNKIHQPKVPYRPKDMPLVAWNPWTDIRSREDIRRLNISFPFGTMPSKWTLKIRQSYYAAALYVDHLIGKLMLHVDTRKTVIVLTSDHGWSLGENGLWAKYSNFDVALKSPLLFLGSGIPRKVIHEPVELINIFPTLVDLANLARIPQCTNTKDKSLCIQGKSLEPFIYQNITSRSFAISQYPRPSVYPQKNSDKPRLKKIKIMGYSIRTKRYRYTEWISFNNTLFTINWNKKHGIELYDHKLDPYESINLRTNKHYKNVINYLSKLLKTQIDTFKVETH
ncbi:hypothetical protein K1T71_004873 [Dendrolimus kikuchii]|uniref:Uncharacterized protein n=1 Tax=Dendrolimus kikuchii TaxID=765133 RepID=A0ACC1D5E7_9NEOP|nr:hypothetical protein K1T71_004873 [Dendrolimus kikuchii]